MPPRLLVSRSGSRPYNRLLPRRSSLTISSEVDSQVLTATCSRTSNSSSTRAKANGASGVKHILAGWLETGIKKKLYQKYKTKTSYFLRRNSFFLFLFSSVLNFSKTPCCPPNQSLNPPSSHVSRAHPLGQAKHQLKKKKLKKKYRVMNSP